MSKPSKKASTKTTSFANKDRKQKTRIIAIIIPCLALVITAVLYYPQITRRISLTNLLKSLSPEIKALVGNGSLDLKSVDKIMSLQENVSYEIARPPCDPKEYACDVPTPKPSTEEKISRYYIEGGLGSEFFYIPEKDHKEMLIKILTNNSYQYSRTIPSCNNQNMFGIAYISSNKNDVILLNIVKEATGMQHLSGIFSGTVDHINYKCL